MLSTARHGGVLELVLDRPEAYNAINPDLRNALAENLDGAEASGVRAILVRGNGRGFCSGADLKAMRPSRAGIETTKTMRLSSQKLVRAYLDCPIPIVSAVHGVAAGIGLTLALCADICIAADDARFTPAFVNRGIVPDGGIAFWLPRMIGLPRAKEFLMRGEPLPAQLAAEWGLVSRTVAPEELVATGMHVAHDLATKPTVTLSLLKQMLAQSFDSDLSATLFAERAAQGLSAATDDAAEGTTAFLEKRTPVFRGH